MSEDEQQWSCQNPKDAPTRAVVVPELGGLGGESPFVPCFTARCGRCDLYLACNVPILGPVFCAWCRDESLPKPPVFTVTGVRP